MPATLERKELIVSLIVRNLLLFKVGWLALVMGAAAGMAWAGLLVGGAVVIAHLLSSKDFEKELWFLTMTLFVAIGWENLLVSSGALTYASSEIAFGAAPAWILMLWLVFATTMNVGMQWLRGFWMFPVGAGLIGGPLSFYVGAKLGAVQFSDPILALVFISIGWALLLPCVVVISKAFDGYQEVQHV
jgi:hypothetical protein